MTDANTYFINRHLAEIDEHIAREEAEWPTCEGCGDRVDPTYLNENDLCDECNMPSPEEVEQLLRQYHAEKRAGLLKTPEELEQELRDAGRIGR